MSHPRTITVLLPVFNGASVVERAISSVWEQRLPDGYGLEIHAIEDASADESGKVLRLLEARSPIPLRISANRVNELTAPSYNRVLRGLESDFVTILHQDDLYPPERFSAQLAHFESRPRLEAVFASGVNLFADGRRTELQSERAKQLLAAHPRDVVEALQRDMNPIFVQPAIFRTPWLRSVGFDEGILSDDWGLLWRMFQRLAVDQYCFLDEAVYLRHKHEHNLHRNRAFMAALYLQVIDRVGREGDWNAAMEAALRYQVSSLRQSGDLTQLRFVQRLAHLLRLDLDVEARERPGRGDVARGEPPLGSLLDELLEEPSQRKLLGLDSVAHAAGQSANWQRSRRFFLAKRLGPLDGHFWRPSRLGTAVLSVLSAAGRIRIFRRLLSLFVAVETFRFRSENARPA